MDVAIAKIRKNYKGEVIKEEIKVISDNPTLLLKDLGQIFARVLSNNSEFIKFCEEYRNSC